MTDPMHPFFGLLTRIGPNQWQWADGSPEPRVSDLTLAGFYRFRLEADAVAIPKYQIRRDPNLAWASNYPIGVGRSAKYHLVRLTDWEGKWGPRVIGARWKREDTAGLIEKAERLRRSETGRALRPDPI